MSKRAQLAIVSLGVLVSSGLSGCRAVMAVQQMQITNDRQDMFRQYKTCLEENRGNPAAVEKLCKPYLDAIRALRGPAVVVRDGN